MNKVIDAAVADEEKRRRHPFKVKPGVAIAAGVDKGGAPPTKYAHWQNVHGTPHCPGSAVVVATPP